MSGFVVHPTDFSETAAVAEAQAVTLARALGAELILLHVAQEPVLYGETPFGHAELSRVFKAEREWAEEALEVRAAAARAAGVQARGIVRVGAPAAEITAFAVEETPALIVIGTHGRGRLARFMLGSVADRVVRTAPCPVVTVRETARRASAVPAA